MNSLTRFLKPSVFVLLILLAVLIQACTFQVGINTQVISTLSEDQIVSTSPPVGNEQQDSEELEEKPIGTTDVFSPDSISTSEIDPYKSVDPQGERVYFWYFLPPQIPADIALNQVVDLFNENNPYDIFVDAYNQSTSAEIISRTLPLLNTPDVPGIIMTNPDLVYRLHDGLADLNPMIKNPTIGFTQQEQENFVTQMISQAQFAGWSESQFAFPMSRNVEAVNYNLEWLFELDNSSTPANLQQLNQTACLASTRPMSGASTGDPTGFTFVPSLAVLGAFTEAFDGSLYQPENNTYQVNSDESIAAMNYLYALSQGGCLTTQNDIEQGKIAFSQAETLYLLSSASEFQELDELISANLSFSWDAIGVPGTEAPRSPTILFGPNLSIPSSTPEQMVAAWMFIKFFQSSDAQRIWIQATGGYPLSRTISADFPMPAAYWQIFSELEDAPALPAYPLIDVANQRVAAAMEEILSGADIERSLNSLQSGLNRLTLNFYATSTH